ncbi:hypothetical protein BDN72DRAFT_863023 [Pluteus cervinus]|uniref:Uncharacterized protein n=1 Tax=Pluteus cervinus TaxID=181527 RepID=A0ACD3A916_9AGAR|nr:hypothetical protein BDN72DRAFT_863023 [Pluteus cervinus]
MDPQSTTSFMMGLVARWAQNNPEEAAALLPGNSATVGPQTPSSAESRPQLGSFGPPFTQSSLQPSIHRERDFSSTNISRGSGHSPNVSSTMHPPSSTFIHSYTSTNGLNHVSTASSSNSVSTNLTADIHTAHTPPLDTNSNPITNSESYQPRRTSASSGPIRDAIAQMPAAARSRQPYLPPSALAPASQLSTSGVNQDRLASSARFPRLPRRGASGASSSRQGRPTAGPPTGVGNRQPSRALESMLVPCRLPNGHINCKILIRPPCHPLDRPTFREGPDRYFRLPQGQVYYLRDFIGAAHEGFLRSSGLCFNMQFEPSTSLRQIAEITIDRMNTGPGGFTFSPLGPQMAGVNMLPVQFMSVMNRGTSTNTLRKLQVWNTGLLRNLTLQDMMNDHRAFPPSVLVDGGFYCIHLQVQTSELRGRLTGPLDDGRTNHVCIGARERMYFWNPTQAGNNSTAAWTMEEIAYWYLNGWFCCLVLWNQPEVIIGTFTPGYDLDLIRAEEEEEDSDEDMSGLQVVSLAVPLRRLRSHSRTQAQSQALVLSPASPAPTVLLSPFNSPTRPNSPAQVPERIMTLSPPPLPSSLPLLRPIPSSIWDDEARRMGEIEAAYNPSAARYSTLPDSGFSALQLAYTVIGINTDDDFSHGLTGNGIEEVVTKFIELCVECVANGDFTPVFRGIRDLKIYYSSGEFASGDGPVRDLLLHAWAFFASVDQGKWLKPASDGFCTMQTLLPMPAARFVPKEDRTLLLSGVMGATAALMNMCGIPPPRIGPLVIAIILEHGSLSLLNRAVVAGYCPELADLLDRWIRAGPRGNINEFRDHLAHYFELTPESLRERTADIHKLCSVTMLYKGIMGHESLDNPQWDLFHLGYCLPSRNGFNLPDLVKNRLGGTLRFVDCLWAARISDPGLFHDSLDIRVVPPEFIAALQEGTSESFKALVPNVTADVFSNLLKGYFSRTGIPSIELYEEFQPRMVQLYDTSDEAARSQALRAQLFTWAATGSPTLPVDSRRTLEVVCVMNPFDSGYAHSHGDLFMEQGKVSWWACLDRAILPGPKIIELARAVYPNSDFPSFTQAFDQWLLMESLTAPGSVNRH